MPPATPLLSAVCALLLLPLAAHADEAPPTPQTLAQALAGAERPKADVFLAVAADKVALPKDTDPPVPSLPPTQVAEAYGRAIQTFETVTAIAPLTMTVVYPPPDTPNPYDGMPPGQVLKLLTRDFSKAQWKAFLSPTGLGMADLTTDTQRQLFDALFPDGHLVVEKDNPTGPNDPNTRQDIQGNSLTQARLRLGFLTSLALQYVGKPDEHVFADGFEPPGAPARYFMMNAQGGDVDREFGAQVRETLPNAPKPSDLDLDAPALKATVRLDSVRTVDDLAARIGSVAHLELHADSRYGARAVTRLGPSSARAKDLLQALALCVCGTYRKVGPAFVLTDDLTGLGTKHAQWKAFEDKAAAMLPGGGPLYAGTQPPQNVPYTVQDIPWGDDPMAFTTEQQAQFWKGWRTDPMQGGGGSLDVTVPFDKLSPAQQEAAHLDQQDNEKQHLGTTLDGTVMVQAEPELEVTLPSLDGPVLVFQSYQGLLPYPNLTPAEQEASRKRIEDEDPFPATENTPLPPGPLRPIVRGFARRAVRIAPRTPQDVTRALAALGALGFNEAWIEIAPDPAQNNTSALALLALAVRQGRAAHVSVFPDLCLLRWGDGTPPALQDRDILDRTVSQAAKTLPYLSPDAVDTVTPFAPEVVQRLTALARTIGSVPGIGGMVWDDMTPLGYQSLSEGMAENDWGNPLGYAEAGRLAFIRAAHTDPVDLYTNEYVDERAHVSVPGFSDDFNQERALYDRWRKVRAEAGLSLARQLGAALPPSFGGRGPRLPLLVPPLNFPNTSVYGSWDNLSQAPPSEEFIAPRGPDGQILMGVPNTEQIPSALSYRVVFVFENPLGNAQTWARAAAFALRTAARKGDRNIVLDATHQPGLLQALADVNATSKVGAAKE